MWRVYFLCAMFASHWVKPVDETSAVPARAFRAAKRRSVPRATGVARPSRTLGPGHAAAELRGSGCGSVEMLHRITSGEPRVLGRASASSWSGASGAAGIARHGRRTGIAQREIQERGNRSFEATGSWCSHSPLPAGESCATRVRGDAASLQPFCAVSPARPPLARNVFALATAPCTRRHRERRAETSKARWSGADARWVALCPENRAISTLERACAASRRSRRAADLYDRASAAANGDS